MKKIKLFLLLLITINLSVAQTIHTADNNPGAVGGVNVFTGATALTDAIAAAIAGDIIHVVRSNIDYAASGAITIDKQLTVFGIGLNPDTDGGDLSTVSTINIVDPVASGSRISGLNISSQLGLGGTAGSLTNLLIENSRIRWIQHLDALTTLSGVIIRNNVIGSGFTTSEEKIDLLAGSIANITIANNVIYSMHFGNHGTVTASNGTTIENNLFVGNSNGTVHAFENLNGCSVKNNIFHGLRPWSSGSFTNNTFENNLSFSTGADGFSTASGNTSTNNLVGQDPLMANVPLALAVDYSTFDPTLNVGTPSPAIGAGEGGTDMGVFGGGSPMTLEGTLIPTIQAITLPSIVVKGVDLPVQIQAKGN